MTLCDKIEMRIGKSKKYTDDFHKSGIAEDILENIELGITTANKSPQRDNKIKQLIGPSQRNMVIYETKLGLHNPDIQRYIKINRVKRQMMKHHHRLKNLNIIQSVIGPESASQLAHTNYYEEVQLAFTDISRTGNKLGENIDNRKTYQHLEEKDFYRKRGKILFSHLAYDLEKIGVNHLKKLHLIPQEMTFLQFIDTNTKEELLAITEKFVTYLQSGIPESENKNQTDRVIRLTHPDVFGKILVFRNEQQIDQHGATLHTKKAIIFDHDLSYLRAQGHVQDSVKKRSQQIDIFWNELYKLKLRIHTQSSLSITEEITKLTKIVGNSKDPKLVKALNILLGIKDTTQDDSNQVNNAKQYIEDKLDEFQYIINTIHAQTNSSLSQYTEDKLRRKFSCTEIYALLHNTKKTPYLLQNGIEIYLKHFLQALEGKRSKPFSVFAQEIKKLFGNDYDFSQPKHTNNEQLLQKLGQLIQTQGMVYRAYLREHEIKLNTRSVNDLPLKQVLEKIEQTGENHFGIHQFKPYIETLQKIITQNISEEQKKQLTIPLLQKMTSIKYGE